MTHWNISQMFVLDTCNSLKEIIKFSHQIWHLTFRKTQFSPSSCVQNRELNFIPIFCTILESRKWVFNWSVYFLIKTLWCSDKKKQSDWNYLMYSLCPLRSSSALSQVFSHSTSLFILNVRVRQENVRLTYFLCPCKKKYIYIISAIQYKCC